MIRILIVLLLIFVKAEAQSSALQLADSLYINGNYSKAIAKYKAYSNQAEVYDKIAKSYMAIGNYRAAADNYKKSVEANPENALVKYEYAKLLSRTKKYDEASMLFNELMNIDSQNPNYHYELGLVLQKQNDSTAINRFLFAYDLDNTHQKAIIKIAKHFLIKRENDLVEIYINKGLENYADNPALLSLKAQNYYWKEDYINAIKWFEKLLTLGESSEFIHEKLSLCYAQEYEYEKAIEHRKIVLKYSPNDVTSMYVLGTYYQKVKDFENAEKYIKQFILLSNIPFDEEYTKLGRIYNQQKKYKEAIEMFQMALKEDSSNVSAQFFLVRSKDEYYADLDAKIKLYEDFKVKYPKQPYLPLAEMRLSELKKEKFLDKD